MVWMADGSTGWTVRSGGDILKTEDGGITWTPQVSGASRTLLGVSGVSASKVVAVGRGGSLQAWDGVEWTGQSAGTEENLNAVIGIAEDDFWVCGDGGTVLHWDGAGWSKSPTPVESDLKALWASGHDDVWAVGGDQVIRWDSTI